MQTTKQRADQIGAAVFLIGLGVIAFFNFWWPGIMFVIAVSLLASDLMTTNGVVDWQSNRVRAAIVVVVIGLIGFVNLWQLWPILLIAIGVFMLMQRNTKREE
jgi:hypothetical protein